MSKNEYMEIMPGLREHLGQLQRKACRAGLPSIIVFDGWGASGKGEQMNRLLMALDPRGFKVYWTGTPSDTEKARPLYWRFWEKTPQNGEIVLFNRSWCVRLLTHMFDGKIDDKDASLCFEQSNHFEKTLVDSGCLINKFFLHISKKEQKTRLDKLDSDPASAWMASKQDWDQNRHYERFMEAADLLISRTDMPYAPWTIVEANDKHFAATKIIKTIIHSMEIRLSDTTPAAPDAKVWRSPVPAILGKVDLSRSLEPVEYKRELDELQSTIKRHQYRLYAKGVPVVVVFEGWDAAGKGGCIKRLTENMDPRGYRVVPIKAPNDVEKAHHYLWRFWNKFPAKGQVAIFDRSWYGRVLVERVEGFCTPREWGQAYVEINEMERQFEESGALVIKFWLHIDMAEQLRRFEDRELDPFKSYKLTDEDWRNRDKHDQYLKAVNEMLHRTDTAHAPWTIVEANDKHYARVKVLQTVAAAMEQKA